MFEYVKFNLNYYWMEVVMWWDDLWMSDEEKDAIGESLRKGVNREDVLCGEHI